MEVERMNELTNKQKREFDKYMNEQFKILKGHHERIMNRIFNKLMELGNE